MNIHFPKTSQLALLLAAVITTCLAPAAHATPPVVKAAQANTVSVQLEAQPILDENGKPFPITPDDMRNIQQVLAMRIDRLGSQISGEIEILKQHRIKLSLTGVKPELKNHIITGLTLPGKLSLHAAHPLHNSVKTRAEAMKLAKKVFAREEIVPGYRAAIMYKKDENGNFLKDKSGKLIPDEYYLVKRKAGVSGADIDYAQAEPNRPGITYIRLTDKGAADMRKFTRGMKQGEFIITLLDDKVVSAASLMAKELGKHFQISGQKDKAESEQLAAALNNPLANPLKVLKSTP